MRFFQYHGFIKGSNSEGVPFVAVPCQSVYQSNRKSIVAQTYTPRNAGQTLIQKIPPKPRFPASTIPMI